MSGILVATTDQVVPIAKLSLVLRGDEEVIMMGGNGGKVPWRAQFLREPYRFFAPEAPSSSTDLGPGNFRIPFSFPVAANYPTTLQTTFRTEDRGYWGSHDAQGVFVEYSLEVGIHASILSGVSISLPLRIVSSNLTLGSFPAPPATPSQSELGLSLTLDDSDVRPGADVRGTWAKQSPKGKHLESAKVGVGRRIDVRNDPDGRWTERYRVYPDYPANLELYSQDGPNSGNFELSVRRDAGEAPNQSGVLYRAFWTVYLAVITHGNLLWGFGNGHHLDIPLLPSKSDSLPPSEAN